VAFLPQSKIGVDKLDIWCYNVYIMKERTMKETIKVIEAYQKRNGIVGFLETLQAMQSKYHELSTIEQMSFDQFMTAGREMFMADGNE